MNDCDVDDRALVAQLEARFGESPVHVKTPKGMHLYYLANGAMPSLRSEGLRVARRMSLTTCSAAAFVVTGFSGAVLRFLNIFNSNWGKDEPQILRYAISLNCSMGADGGHGGRRSSGRVGTGRGAIVSRRLARIRN